MKMVQPCRDLLQSLMLHLSTSSRCSLGFLFTNSQLVRGLFIEVTQRSGHPFAFISLLVLKEVKANDRYKQPLLARLENWPRNSANNTQQAPAFKRGCLASARLQKSTTSQGSPASHGTSHPPPQSCRTQAGVWAAEAGCLPPQRGWVLFVSGSGWLRSRSHGVCSQLQEE